MKCEYCNNPIKFGSTYCPSCGAAVTVSEQPPSVPPPAYQTQSQPYPAPPPTVIYVQSPPPAPAAEPVTTGGKDKWSAAILALLFGGLGIHKFYLGQWVQGLLYLIFCWTGIPLILGLLECVVYLCCNEKRFRQQYK